MDKYTIRSVDGSVDVAASVNAYASRLSKWVSENEIPVADISAAVDSVFDKHGSTPIRKMVLISYVMGILKPEHDKVTSVQTSIEAFLKSSDRFKAIKGKNGGMVRLVAA